MIRGFIAGSFDVIHPGYIDMLSHIKKKCEYLIVGLHSDPSIDRPNKLKPILSVEDRYKILMSLRQVDEVIVYNTELDLEKILIESNIDIRFLGDDYINKNYTAKHLNIQIYYINRDHGWSSTIFKKKIMESISKNKNNE